MRPRNLNIGTFELKTGTIVAVAMFALLLIGYPRSGFAEESAAGPGTKTFASPTAA